MQFFKEPKWHLKKGRQHSKNLPIVLVPPHNRTAFRRRNKAEYFQHQNTTPLKYDSYHIEASSTFLKFEFYSKGPKGIIKKQVIFRPFENNPIVFNLGFGDVDESGEINDTVITGNNDSQKVLATVALTVYKFFEIHPDCYVFAVGSSPSRTRLYRMGINNNLDEILIDFELFGFNNKSWELFKKGRQYEAFLISKRK